MYIKNIKLNHFRNYKTLSLTFHKGINIIYGENAQGKTNLLESIYVLALTKSHRSFIDSHLIQENNERAKIVGNVYIDEMTTEFEIAFEEKKKQLKIDGDIVKKVGDYLSKMNIIIFYPDDLELVKGSPNVRRRFLNLELSQLNSNYYNILNDYNRLLKMRNDYIKLHTNQFDENYFSVLTSYLIDKSILLLKMRKKFIDKINIYVSDIFYRISSLQNFQVVYQSFIEYDPDEKSLKEKIETLFQSLREKEFRYKTTLIGPHRDDFSFYVGDMQLKSYGSQGQQRMAILSLKLAEIEIFKSYKKETPILLLDDVFSELDDGKKNNLLHYMNEDIQTIITTTDLQDIDESIRKKSKLIEIVQGTIKTLEEVE